MTSLIEYVTTFYVENRFVHMAIVNIFRWATLFEKCSILWELVSGPNDPKNDPKLYLDLL